MMYLKTKMLDDSIYCKCSETECANHFLKRMLQIKTIILLMLYNNNCCCICYITELALIVQPHIFISCCIVMLIAWQGRAFQETIIRSITLDVIYSIHQTQFDDSGCELGFLLQIASHRM